MGPLVFGDSQVLVAAPCHMFCIDADVLSVGRSRRDMD